MQMEHFQNWPNFNIVETEKMKWMKDIELKLPNLKPGQVYEAR